MMNGVVSDSACAAWILECILIFGTLILPPKWDSNALHCTFVSFSSNCGPILCLYNFLCTFMCHAASLTKGGGEWNGGVGGPCIELLWAATSQKRKADSGIRPLPSLGSVRVQIWQCRVVRIVSREEWKKRIRGVFSAFGGAWPHCPCGPSMPHMNGKSPQPLLC